MKKTAQERIAEFYKFGSKLGLERMRALLAELGNPEKNLRVLHVAGTNGKGSVCRYLYDVLRESGYSVGLYSSPYVLDFRERIEANGEWISQEDLEVLTDEVILAAEKVEQKTKESPTEFEIITAIGLKYFTANELDFVVLETGLGGRGDSTNIFEKPEISIITSISLDHMDRLGATVEEIAGEKAGIIKSGVPTVSGAEGGAARVIARRAYELSAPLIDASKIKTAIREQSLDGTIFSAQINGRRFDSIEISMPGAHQVGNAVVALTAWEVLRERGIVRADGEALRRGMKKAKVPARFQVDRGEEGEHAHIYDGAHNEAGALALAKTLKTLCPNKKLLFVLSVLKDKDADAMLKIFKEAAGEKGGFVAAESKNERSLSAEELAEKMKALHIPLCGSLKSADEPLPALAQNYDIIVYAGSLYFMSDLLTKR